MLPRRTRRRTRLHLFWARKFRSKIALDADKHYQNMNGKLVSSLESVTRARLGTAANDTSIIEVAKLLSGTQISLVVICNRHGVMAGVITKTNIVRRIGYCGGNACMTPAEEVMTREVSYCKPSDSLPEVLSKMESGGFVHLPVIDENMVPVGVVNARDALKALLGEEKYEESLLRNYVMGVGYQ